MYPLNSSTSLLQYLSGEQGHVSGGACMFVYWPQQVAFLRQNYMPPPRGVSYPWHPWGLGHQSVLVEDLPLIAIIAGNKLFQCETFYTQLICSLKRRISSKSSDQIFLTEHFFKILCLSSLWKKDYSEQEQC